jgi:hypothetical protein
VIWRRIRGEKEKKKHTDHEFGHVVVDLVEDDLHHHRVPVLELLLQEAAPVLVLAQGVDVPDHLFDARVLASCYKGKEGGKGRGEREGRREERGRKGRKGRGEIIN